MVDPVGPPPSINPNASAPNPLWPPDRKFIAAGAGGIIAWFIIYVLGALPQHIILDPQLADTLPTLITLILYYIVPARLQDVVKKVTNEVVTLANADQSNPTTAKVVSPAESDQVTLEGLQSNMVPPSSAHVALALLAGTPMTKPETEPVAPDRVMAS